MQVLKVLRVVEKLKVAKRKADGDDAAPQVARQRVGDFSPISLGNINRRRLEIGATGAARRGRGSGAACAAARRWNSGHVCRCVLHNWHGSAASMGSEQGSTAVRDSPA